MTIEDFKILVDKRFASCRELMCGAKHKEYTRGDDKLHNFKKAAAYDNETPERALWGMLKKHLVNISDIINDLDHGVVPTANTLNEKIGDVINYLVLLEALLTERWK